MGNLVPRDGSIRYIYPVLTAIELEEAATLSSNAINETLDHNNFVESGGCIEVLRHTLIDPQAKNLVSGMIETPLGTAKENVFVRGFNEDHGRRMLIKREWKGLLDKMKQTVVSFLLMYVRDNPGCQHKK